MQRNFVHKLMSMIIPLVAVLVLLATSVSALSAELAAQAKPDGSIRLEGNVSPLVHLAHLLKAANTGQILNISVGLALRNQNELESLLSNLYNSSSPQYHQFLTSEEFAAEFGPTPDQQQQVIAFLHSRGLSVTGVSPNGTLIDVRGTVAQVKAAFQVTINTYQLGTRIFYANNNAPTIPGSLSSLVLSIGGLDNAAKWHPEYYLIPTKRAAHMGSHPGYAPADLRAGYDSNALGTQGKNQAVAIFELDGYQSSDITQYLQAYNLGTPSITNVYVDGFNGSAGSGAIEDSLDIEVMAAMAPQAAQIIYEGPNSTRGVNDTYNKIITDNKAQVISTSWGLCEASTGNSELYTLDNIFKQAAAQGISVFAASGDGGAYDCQSSFSSFFRTLGVDSPASDPYVTGAGGTKLGLSNGGYGSESVWSDQLNDAGSGGGLSNTFSRPNWQTGPGVQNKYSNGKREVPDVSADADPNTGYSVYCTAGSNCDPSNPWIEVGGTSGAAPLWAGATAITNEYLQNQGKGRVGFANPVLYGLENAQQSYVPFHDITVGNNLYYPAMPNYDLASGWGSPDIFNLARDIANGVNTSPSPTATANPSPSPSPSPTAKPSPSPTAKPSPTVIVIPSPTPICFFGFCF